MCNYCCRCTSRNWSFSRDLKPLLASGRNSALQIRWANSPKFSLVERWFNQYGGLHFELTSISVYDGRRCHISRANRLADPNHEQLAASVQVCRAIAATHVGLRLNGPGSRILDLGHCRHGIGQSLFATSWSKRIHTFLRTVLGIVFRTGSPCAIRCWRSFSSVNRSSDWLTQLVNGVVLSI